MTNIHWIIEKAREFQKNIYAKAFDCVDYNKLWNILKEMGIPDHLTCLLRNMYVGQEATELDMEQQTGSKQGKEYVKAVYCHPAYLTYMQSTSCKMLGWMKHKIAGRNINNLRYADKTTFMAESEEELKSLQMKAKEESEKTGFKLNIQKMKMNVIQSHHFMPNRQGNNGISD